MIQIPVPGMVIWTSQNKYHQLRWYPQTMSKKNAISYVKNEPPAFIQKFKEKIGYKEEPDVNAKVTLQSVEHRLTVILTHRLRRHLPLLLLPCKEPNTLNECIWFHLKTLRSVGQHIKSSIFFTFKTISNLQLKLCTLYCCSVPSRAWL